MLDVGRWLVEVALLTALLVPLARATRRRALVLLTLGSFAVRVGLGEALYFISLRRLPVMRGQQLPDGFWQFGYDGYVFHFRVVSALQHAPVPLLSRIHAILVQSPESLGIDSVDGLNAFSRMLAVLYAAFGSHPSVGLAVVAAAAAAIVPLAYLTAMRCGLSGRQGLIVSAVVASWPSTLIWGSQLLRDPFEWFGAFVVAFGVVLLIGRNERHTIRGTAVALLIIAGGEVFTSRFSTQAAAAWLLAILAGLGMFALSAQVPHRRWLVTGVLVTLIAIIGSIPVPASENSSERLLGSILRMSAQLTGTQLAVSDRLTAADKVYLTDLTGDPDYSTKYPRAALRLLGRNPNDYLPPEPTPTPYPPGYITPNERRYLDAVGRETNFADNHPDMAYRFLGRGPNDRPPQESPNSPPPPGFTADDVRYLTSLTDDPFYASKYPDIAAKLLGRQPGEAPPPPVSNAQSPSARGNVAKFSSAESCAPVAPLLRARAQFMDAGGASQVDNDLVLESCSSVLAYLPRAAEHAFLWPLPGDSPQKASASAGLRYFGLLDGVLLWLLSVGLIVGGARAIRLPAPEKVTLALYAILLALSLGLVVTNFGSLFRLRLTAFLPAVVVAVDGWSLILDQITRRTLLLRARRREYGSPASSPV